MFVESVSCTHDEGKEGKMSSVKLLTVLFPTPLFPRCARNNRIRQSVLKKTSQPALKTVVNDLFSWLTIAL